MMHLMLLRAKQLSNRDFDAFPSGSVTLSPEIPASEFPATPQTGLPRFAAGPGSPFRSGLGFLSVEPVEQTEEVVAHERRQMFRFVNLQRYRVAIAMCVNIRPTDRTSERPRSVLRLRNVFRNLKGVFSVPFETRSPVLFRRKKSSVHSFWSFSALRGRLSISMRRFNYSSRLPLLRQRIHDFALGGVCRSCGDPWISSGRCASMSEAPPSTSRICPVIQFASAEQSSATALQCRMCSEFAHGVHPAGASCESSSEPLPAEYSRRCLRPAGLMRSP